MFITSLGTVFTPHKMITSTNNDINKLFESTYVNQQTNKHQEVSDALSLLVPSAYNANAWTNHSGAININNNPTSLLITAALKQQPNDYDVVCGSRNKYHFHPGNLFLMKLTKSKMDAYAAASRVERSRIISKIVDTIREESPTRTGFVQNDFLSGKFIPVSEQAAREKISQAFRDLLHKHYRSSSKARTEHRVIQRKRTLFLLGTNGDNATQESETGNQMLGYQQKKRALLQKSDSMSSWSSELGTFDAYGGEITNSSLDVDVDFETKYLLGTNDDNASQETKTGNQMLGYQQNKRALLQKSDSMSSWSSEMGKFDAYGGEITHSSLDVATVKFGCRPQPHPVSTSSSSGASVTENTIRKMNHSSIRRTSTSSYDSFAKESSSLLSSTSGCAEATQPYHLVTAVSWTKSAIGVLQETRQQQTSSIPKPIQPTSRSMEVNDTSSNDIIKRQTTQEESDARRKNVPTASFLCREFLNPRSW